MGDTGDFSGQKQSSNPNEWTIAIDLKMNMKDDGPHGHLGAEDKSYLLQQLKDESKDKPVSLVVQLSESQKPNETTGQVSRYLIRNGDIKQLPAPRVQDPSGLTGDLLRYAGSSQPARHLGLVIFSHGFGVHGIGTDKGPVSLGSLESTIDSALSRLHKQKVDLLAFDGCSMAQADTLARMHNVASHVVASTEYMMCQSENSCGIDLQGWMSRLYRQPGMSAENLGDAAVHQMRDQSVRLGAGTASPTITHFDVRDYDKFARALDGFANQLTAAVGIGNNKQSLRGLIDNAPGYERYYFLDPPYPAPKDLTSFAKSVEEAIDNHLLQDPSGKLRVAAQALVQQEKRIVHSYFGAHQFDVMDPAPSYGPDSDLPPQARVPYDKLGGLSIALPDSQQLAEQAKLKHSLQSYLYSETEIPSWRAFLDRMQ